MEFVKCVVSFLRRGSPHHLRGLEPEYKTLSVCLKEILTGDSADSRSTQVLAFQKAGFYHTSFSERWVLS